MHIKLKGTIFGVHKIYGKNPVLQFFRRPGFSIQSPRPPAGGKCSKLSQEDLVENPIPLFWLVKDGILSMAYNNRHIDPYKKPAYTKQPGSCFHCASGLQDVKIATYHTYGVAT